MCHLLLYRLLFLFGIGATCIKKKLGPRKVTYRKFFLPGFDKMWKLTIIIKKSLSIGLEGLY